MKNYFLVLILGFVFTLLLSSCAQSEDFNHNPIPFGSKKNSGQSSSQNAGDDGTNPPLKGPYYVDLKPLFEAKCSTCHNSNSTFGNWLDYSQAYAKRDLIMNRAVVRQDMPLGSKLDEKDITLIRLWVESGAAEKPILNPN